VLQTRDFIIMGARGKAAEPPETLIGASSLNGRADSAKPREAVARTQNLSHDDRRPIRWLPPRTSRTGTSSTYARTTHGGGKKIKAPCRLPINQSRSARRARDFPFHFLFNPRQA
jgi:hypothetical protein